MRHVTIAFVASMSWVAACTGEEAPLAGGDTDAAIFAGTGGTRSGNGGSAPATGGRSTGSGGNNSGNGGSSPTSGGAPSTGGGSGGANSGGSTTGGSSSNSGGSSSGGSSSGGADAGTPGPGFYTTNFDGTENPLSESGAWKPAGSSWTAVRKDGGIAFGTQTGTNGYDDSYAYLSGFAANQQAEAVIHLEPDAVATATATHEVELLMRWSASGANTRGYECNIGFAGGGTYAQIVRWNGAIGDFSPIGGGSPGTLHDGDVMRATAVGSVISLYLNGALVTTVDDPTFADGNPGMGFFRRETGTSTEFAFTSFTAKNL